MTPPPYRRLPGRARAGFCLHSLWLGGDHLLAVEDLGVKQRFRRFAYGDVKLLRVRVTSAQGLRLSIAFVLGAAALAVALASPAPGRAAWLAVAALLLLALGRELWLGPTCITTLHTAVSSAPLPSLGRLRTAERAIALLAPLIRARQQPAPPSLDADVLRPLLPNAAERETEPRDRRRADLPRQFSFAFAVIAWASAGALAGVVARGGRELALAAAAILFLLFVLSVVTAASAPPGRLRAAAIGGVAAGVIAISGVWLLQTVAGFQPGMPGARAVEGPLGLLAAPPLAREPIPWLLLLTTLLAASASGLQALRALRGRPA